jgi:hypothetical protein
MSAPSFTGYCSEYEQVDTAYGLRHADSRSRNSLQLPACAERWYLAIGISPLYSCFTAPLDNLYYPKRKRC